VKLLETRTELLRERRRLRLARLSKGTPLVLLHGYPETLQIFSALAPLLADRFDVIALDWPGLGGSDAWPGGATPHALADRLAQILDDLHVERAAVAGMDMGGQPALAFAARHPQRCAGLTVMNSLVIGDAPTSWEIRLLRRFRFNELVLRRLPRVVFTQAERTFLAPGERLPPELRDELWRRFRERAPREFLVRMCAGYEGTLRTLPELYRQVRAPCLIVWGERDRHFPPQHAERLHEMVPGSRLEILAGAEHWMVWSRAADVAAIIQRL